MNTLQKAVTGVGLSAAIGLSAYAAEQIFETPPRDQVHERIMECRTLPDELNRNRCGAEAIGSNLNILDVLQLGSLVALAGTGYLGFRALRREVEDQGTTGAQSAPVPSQLLVKEFAPRDSDIEKSAGRLIVRSYRYGCSPALVDELCDAMQADAATFEPPIELSRSDVEIVHYGGDMYKGTFGAEVTIPEGHIVPDTYTRIAAPERTF